MRTQQGSGGSRPSYSTVSYQTGIIPYAPYHGHLVIENLALACLGLRDQTLVEDIKHILADLLELGLDLLAVLADDRDMLV